jgi:hypothetical protein
LQAWFQGNGLKLANKNAAIEQRQQNSYSTFRDFTTKLWDVTFPETATLEFASRALKSSYAQIPNKLKWQKITLNSGAPANIELILCLLVFRIVPQTHRRTANPSSFSSSVPSRRKSNKA